MRIWSFVILIVGLTLILFFPVLHFDFINFDDPYMVTGNPRLLQPLSFETLFAPLSGLIHPLTNLTYWLDTQIYGLNPAGFHLTNVLFHVIAAAALFFWVFNLTKDLAVATVLTAAFAWHPTHVESVAWITERKDVVSAAFFWLCLLSHSFTIGKFKKPWWILTWIFAFLSFMGKPLALGLPFILILLEWWKSKEEPSTDTCFRKKNIFLFLTFGSLSFFFGLINVLAQNANRAAIPGSSSASLWRLPLQLIFYVHKTFWPTDLKLIYSSADLAPSLFPLIVFLAVFGLFFYLSFRSKSFRRDTFFGLGFFLLIIGPSLKLIPFGDESPVAERYLYVAQTGLLWPFARSLRQVSLYYRKILIVLFSFILAIYFFLSSQRLPAWQDGPSMWKSLLAVDPQSKIAHDQLAGVALSQERMTEALTELQLGDTESLNNLVNQAFALLRLDRMPEADQKIKQAELLKSDHPKVLNIRGLWLMQTGDLVHAEDFLKRSLASPNQVLAALTKAETQSNLGVLAYRRGDLKDCISWQEEALASSPNYGLARYNLAFCQLQSGQLDKAEDNYNQALQILPRLAMIHHDLGVIAIKRGQLDKAELFFKQALEIDPELKVAQQNLETLKKLRSK